METNDEPWEKSVPTELIPPGTHLRDRFEDAHNAFGQATKVYRYSRLHGIAADEPNDECLEYLKRMQIADRETGDHQYQHLLEHGTWPAIFKAYSDLDLESLSKEALGLFYEFLDIRRANQSRLAIHHLIG